tara:strand:+ start:103 stop:276 length:174 start_codon:yes stop_codon:yes gene_type:complete
MLRDESPAAPAARTIGTVHPYWIQRREQREKASRKRQATSRKQQAQFRMILMCKDNI